MELRLKYDIVWSLVIREERKTRLFQNRVLRRIREPYSFRYNQINVVKIPLRLKIINIIYKDPVLASQRTQYASLGRPISHIGKKGFVVNHVSHVDCGKCSLDVKRSRT